MKNYYKYDELVMKTIINLISYKERHSGEIRISSFNKKSKKCLYLLEVAKIVSSQTGAKLIVEIPFYKKIFFKPLKGIKAKRKVLNGIQWKNFINFTFADETTTPEEIYDEYYAPKI